MMKISRPWIWTLLALALCAAAWGVWRQRSKAAAAVPPPAATVLTLQDSDLWTVQSDTVTLTLPVSGTLRAQQTAWVKARVVGELLQLQVREGDRVQAGQTLGQIDPTEFQARWRQAQQQADAAKAQMDIAQKQWDNNEALVRQGFISQTALQTSQLNLQGARANHLAALAAAEVALKALQDATLRAPIAGVVSQRLSQPGERVALDARIVEIVNLSALELEAAVPAEDASALAVGQSAQLRAEGIEAPVPARVARLGPSAQNASRSVPVYLTVTGAPGLRHGQFAQGHVQTGQLQALAVPLESVRTDKPQPYVQTLRDGQVQHQTVQLGPTTQRGAQSWVVVREGLREGQQVLQGSVGLLREGTAVQMAQPGNAAAR